MTAAESAGYVDDDAAAEALFRGKESMATWEYDSADRSRQDEKTLAGHRREGEGGVLREVSGACSC